MALFNYKGEALSGFASAYAGKRLSILGDSISTFTGYVPVGNATWYTGSNNGVASVDDTWWKKLLNALGMELLVNESWSGSRVTTTAGSDSAGCMARCQKLGTDDTDPNVIIVYLGINDFNNGVALGTYDGTGSFPTVTTTFRESYAIMLDKILTKYPQAEVWVCTLPYCERTGDNIFPEVNGNGVTLDAWNGAIRELAALFGVRVLDQARCGLTYQNMSLYMGDYSAGEGLHPNAAGHTLLANNAVRQMGGYSGTASSQEAPEGSTLPDMVSWHAVRDGSTVTVDIGMDDGSTDRAVISLDGTDTPTKMVYNGRDIPMGWEGF